MARVPLQLGRKTDQAQSPADSPERLINGYVETASQGKEPAPVYGTPGGVVFSQTTSGVVRLVYRMADTLYAVIGTAVYSISSAGLGTLLGNMDAGGPVDAADDGENLVLVNPDTGKIWVATATGLTPVTDPDARAAASVSWLDGYFCFTEYGTDLFFLSDLNNPLSYNALNAAGADWRPGFNWRSLVVEKALYIFKEHSIEAWYDTGDTTTFVFTTRPDVHIPIGIAGRFCATYTNQAVYFLADDLTVRRLDGLVPTRVSTFAVERLIAGAPDLNIRGWSDPSVTRITSHVWRGHLFIVLSNPDGCVVLDQSTQLWHERATYGRAGWLGASYAYCYDEHLFGDAESPTVYRLAADAYDDAGVPLVYDATFPFSYSGGVPFTSLRTELILDTGRGALDLINPKVQLAYSKDGYTWTGWKERGLGAQGEYGRVVEFLGAGRARALSTRVRISDPVPRVMLGAYADLEALSD